MCESVFRSFSHLKFGFVIFWWKNISKKTAREMLVTLTTGVNCINILQVAFWCESF